MLKASFPCVSSLDRRTQQPVLPILCFCAGAQKNMAAKFKGRAKKRVCDPPRAIAKFGFELIADALKALMHPWWRPELRMVYPAA